MENDLEIRANCAIRVAKALHLALAFGPAGIAIWFGGRCLERLADLGQVEEFLAACVEALVPKPLGSR
jgi:hypothetical protein